MCFTKKVEVIGTHKSKTKKSDINTRIRKGNLCISKHNNDHTAYAETRMKNKAHIMKIKRKKERKKLEKMARGKGYNRKNKEEKVIRQYLCNITGNNEGIRRYEIE